MPDTYIVPNPNKALWEKGDFTRIAETMRQSGEELVDSLDLRAGMRVLDLASGDGTTAIPAARTGAEVLGIDIASNLVDAGNARARGMGLHNLRFEEGDASNLAGIADKSFDLVVSIFGAMFAPRPQDVAREMVRVTKPGGRIVMGNWIPNDPTFVSQLLKVSSAFTPPPPEGFVSPMLWGVESNILERFEKAGVPAANVSMARETYLFEGGGTPESYIEEFRQYYGPTMNAFEAAQKDGKEGDLSRQLVELARAHNQSKDGISIPATFMLVTVQRP